MHAVFILMSSLMLAGDASFSADKTESWPAFQGHGAAKLTAENLPINWSEKNNISWRVKIAGYGQSSPVIFNNRVYVTSVSGGMKETFHLSCYELKTGKHLWKKDIVAASKVKNTNFVSKAAPSPVVDADGTIALCESGNLVAFSHKGEIRWQKSLVKDHGPIVSRHGIGSSLTQTDDSLFLSMECDKDPYLLSIEKKTGKINWKVPGLGAATWSTPVLLPVGDGFHLVQSGSGILVGFDPTNGKRLWIIEGLSGNTVPTPVVVGNGKILLGASDRAGNAAAAQSKPQNSNGLIAISRTAAGRFHPSFVWRAKRATSSFGSPVVAKNHVYFVNRSGVLYCLDLATGKELYAKRIGQAIWATPLVVGNRIYFPGKEGTTTVVKAGSKFEKLAVNDLSAKSEIAFEEAKSNVRALQQPYKQVTTFYAIVAVKKSLLLRTGNELFCIEKK